ncbi:MAG: thioredoxin family protein [Myxococcales bacterium]|nr:MAG: thioredoxin family protein [Myxococcales bacterium]
MKFFESVLLLGLVVSCSTPTKERPAGSAAPALAASGSASATAAPPAPAVSAPPPPLVTEAAPPSRKSSAYPGCGQPIPPDRLWDETTDGEVLDALSEAKACAAEHGRRLLLEFVAPWCDDCREMAKLEEAPGVAETLQRRFERVRINIGKWDRHEALRESFGVRALATYVVIEPKTSKQLAKTTLEPITKPGKKLTADDWRRWLEAH